MAEKKQVEIPADEPKKSGSKLKWIILVVLLLVLLGGGGAAYWFLLGPGAVVPEENGEPSPEEAAKQEKMVSEIVSLPSFIVNLADPLGRRFLRLTLDVEVVSKEAAADLNKFESRVRDAVILLLSSKTYGDLASMESKITLKNEIVDRLNQIIGGARVSNVYFTEFVIQ